MAIFSKNKNKKDKKDSRNSVIPKDALLSSTNPDSSTDSVSHSGSSHQQRQASNTSTISTISNTSGASHIQQSLVPISNGTTGLISGLASGATNGQGPYPNTRLNNLGPNGASPQTGSGPGSRSNSAMSANGLPLVSQISPNNVGVNGGPNGARSPLGLRNSNSPHNNPWPQQQQQQQQSIPPSGLRSPQQLSQSQYPWSRHHISNASPFPRYGHAANAIAARDGEVFVMGGLKGSNVFGDLWVIETGKLFLFSRFGDYSPFSNNIIDSLTGYRLDTEGCPSPRVGHASLTLGNAFIVFGGDTKIEETDDLDDDLYLLNTTTLKWTVANSTGLRPSGRYGHTLSTIGSKVYVFGGQLDDEFFDDLMCYDLTALRSPNAQWLLTNPVDAISPPPRTNHSIVTYQDKLYLFGGTDGKLWYSDTWCFDPSLNSWSLLDCSGFIPAPCEGHSATIVDDIMYVFGGRSSQGKDLGTLSALKLSTRKWFTFQNLGPGPSPRSGHSMTAFAGHKILVMGGESPDISGPEFEAYDQSLRLSTIFVLDTLRINYPPLSDTIPSVTSLSSATPGINTIGTPDNNDNQQYGTNTSGDITAIEAAAPQPINRDIASPSQLYPDSSISTVHNLPHVPSGIEARTNAADTDDSKSNTIFESAEDDRYIKAESRTPDSNNNLPVAGVSESSTENLANIPGAWQQVSSPASSHDDDDYDEPIQVTKIRNSLNGIGLTAVSVAGGLAGIPTSASTIHSSSVATISGGNTETLPTPTGSAPDSAAPSLSVPNSAPVSAPADRSVDTIPEHIIDQSTPRGSQIADEGVPVAGNISQVIERLKASNSWYESELAAARDAGFVPNSRPPVDILKLRRVSQRLTQDNNESLSERDILITALSELKEELNSVQMNVKKQAEAASDRILAVERDRDVALEENKDLKSQLITSSSTNGVNVDESNNEKILAVQQETIERLQKELADAKASRSLLLGDAASLITIDTLKASNAQLEQQLRNQSDRLVVAEHEASQMRAKFEDLHSRHNELTSSTSDKIGVLAAAGAAVAASQGRVIELSQQLDSHKEARGNLELKVNDLQQELAVNQRKLEIAQRELAEYRQLLQNANEQNEHSSKALKDGVDKMVSMWSSSKVFNRRALGVAGVVGVGLGVDAIGNGVVNGNGSGNRSSTVEGEDEDEEDPRYTELQRNLDLATQLHRTHKEAADKATDELTLALSQVSGLKKELADSEASKQDLESQVATMKHELSSTRNDLETHQGLLEEHKKSLNDLTEKHTALADLLSSQSDVSTLQARELNDKMEKALSEHQEAAEARYRSLEEEYNKSLQYVRNTDKALSKTREELTKHKELNAKLQEENDDLRLRSQQDDDDEIGGERSVNSVSSSSNYNNKHFDLQLRDLRAQVIILQEERDELRASSLELKKKAINNAHDIDEARQETQRLSDENAKLLARTKEAEDKVSVLLNTKRASRDPIIDPESGITLDSFSNDLEKIRTERERLSGILRDSPNLDDR